MNPIPTFSLSEWLQQNMPEAYKQKAVKLLDQSGLTPDEARRIFNLAKEVFEYEQHDKVIEYEARIRGLEKALEAKTETQVPIRWWDFIPLALLITAIVLILFLR